jgi:hypothetical protein
MYGQTAVVVMLQYFQIFNVNKILHFLKEEFPNVVQLDGSLQLWSKSSTPLAPPRWT